MGFNQKKEEEFGNLILENTVVGKTLEHFGYKIYNLETANKNFRDILELDDIKDIQVVFPLEDENGELVDTFELISKENYWNAFYEPIWCKIKDVEKVRALEWLFEDFKYKYNLDVNLTYIPHAKSSVKSEVCDDDKHYTSCKANYKFDKTSLEICSFSLRTIIKTI